MHSSCTEQRSQKEREDADALFGLSHAQHVVLERHVFERHQQATAAAAGHHLCLQRIDGVFALAILLCAAIRFDGLLSDCCVLP